MALVWTAADTYDNQPCGVAFGDGICVITNNRAHTSTDGDVWHSSDLTDWYSGGSVYPSVVWSVDRFLVFESGAVEPLIHRVTPGVPPTITVAGPRPPGWATFGGNSLASNGSVIIAASTDRVYWTNADGSGGGESELLDFASESSTTHAAWNGAVFVVTRGGIVYTSPSGTGSWTLRLLPLTELSYSNSLEVVGNAVYVSVYGYVDHLFYSVDNCLTWVEVARADPTVYMSGMFAAPDRTLYALPGAAGGRVELYKDGQLVGTEAPPAPGVSWWYAYRGSQGAVLASDNSPIFYFTAFAVEPPVPVPDPTGKGLRKKPVVTVLPGSPGQPYIAPSTVCTPPPPPNDGGGTPPTSPPSTNPPPTGYYVYQPVDPNNPAAGETRTYYANHPGGAYVCDTVPQMYFVPDPTFPGGLTPVFERRCYWTYP